jgi:phosphatidylglycerol:prolipoprotein diacylglycerol transferase
MSSVPYSRYLIGPVPWYSFLIVTGVVLAIILACREERRSGLPRDTVIDLALWLLPFGIIGARIYYVIFSWDSFRNDLLSVFRIWEGGIAIYGGIIAGVIVLLVFCRVRKLRPLPLCDVIVPGLALAQCIGRWGNWFNMEAYGFTVTNPDLCFFPLAVQIPDDGYAWHLATFFYESVWDLLIFLFLVLARRKHFRQSGDAFFSYLFLYGAGRLVIEEMRTDSLYAGTSVRISQVFSVILCIFVLLRYARILSRSGRSAFLCYAAVPLAAAVSVFVLLYTVTGTFLSSLPAARIIAVLSACAALMLLVFLAVFLSVSKEEVRHADNLD